MKRCAEGGRHAPRRGARAAALRASRSARAGLERSQRVRRAAQKMARWPRLRHVSTRPLRLPWRACYLRLPQHRARAPAAAPATAPPARAAPSAAMGQRSHPRPSASMIACACTRSAAGCARLARVRVALTRIAPCARLATQRGKCARSVWRLPWRPRLRRRRPRSWAWPPGCAGGARAAPGAAREAARGAKRLRRLRSCGGSQR